MGCPYAPMQRHQGTCLGELSTHRWYEQTAEREGMRYEPAGLFPRSCALVFSNLSKTVLHPKIKYTCFVPHSASSHPHQDFFWFDANTILLDDDCHLRDSTDDFIFHNKSITGFAKMKSHSQLAFSVIQLYNFVCCCLFFLFFFNVYGIIFQTRFKL